MPVCESNTAANAVISTLCSPTMADRVIDRAQHLLGRQQALVDPASASTAPRAVAAIIAE